MSKGLRIEVDEVSHVAAMEKLFARAQSADELLDIFLDVVSCDGAYPQARFPFGADRTIEVDRSLDWYRDALAALGRAATVPRRGRYRGMAHPATPRAGSLWCVPERGSVLVMCATASGLVFCAPETGNRWRLELLQAFAAEDFCRFEPWPEIEAEGEGTPTTEKPGG